jgi:hypothetical protein
MGCRDALRLQTIHSGSLTGFDIWTSQMICEKGVEGAVPPLGDAVPKPPLVFLMTDLGLL